MAIQRRSNVQTNAGIFTTPTINKPTNMVAGDMQFIYLALDTVGTTITPPAGFTTLVQDLDSSVGGGQAGGIYYKIATGSEPASQTFTLGTSCGVAIGTWANYDDAGGVIEPYSPATADDAAGSTLTTPSITTLVANDRVYSCYAQDQTGSAGSYAASSPGGATLIVNVWDTVGGTFTGAGVQEETRAAAGAGTHAVTQTTGGDNTRGCLTFIMAIKAVTTFVPRVMAYVA